MSRNGHYGAGSVGHENIVGNENGNFIAVDGIYGLNAAKSDAGFILGDLGALKVGFFAASAR